MPNSSTRELLTRRSPSTTVGRSSAALRSGARRSFSNPHGTASIGLSPSRHSCSTTTTSGSRSPRHMSDLVYYSHCSLDGLIADESGDFSWAFPPDDVHRAANEAAASTGLHLLGRRTYEVMRYWDEPQDGASDTEAEFQRAWAPAQKVVYSRTLDQAGPNARIERDFDPVAARALADASDSDVAIGGADLGGQALRAGIVDVL